MKAIFTLMVFNCYHNGVWDNSRWKNDRVWAWFHTKEEAEKSLRDGPDWYFESGSYQYALIEEVGWGAGGSLNESSVTWFECRESNPILSSPQADYNIIQMKERPPFAHHGCCFSMG